MNPIAITPANVPVQQTPAPLQATPIWMPHVEQHFEQAYNTYDPVVKDIQGGGIQVYGYTPQQQPLGQSGGGSHAYGSVSGQLYKPPQEVQEEPGPVQGPLGPTASLYNGGVDMGRQNQSPGPADFAVATGANGYKQAPGAGSEYKYDWSPDGEVIQNPPYYPPGYSASDYAGTAPSYYGGGDE